MKIFLLAIAVQPILFLFAWVVISAAIYIYEEMHHNIKNLKRAIKYAWWDLEWKLKRW